MSNQAALLLHRQVCQNTWRGENFYEALDHEILADQDQREYGNEGEFYDGLVLIDEAFLEA